NYFAASQKRAGICALERGTGYSASGKRYPPGSSRRCATITSGYSKACAGSALHLPNTFPISVERNQSILTDLQNAAEFRGFDRCSRAASLNDLALRRDGQIVP